MKSTIYDFETLSADPFDGAVVSLAALNFDETRFVESPYEYDELIENCFLIKFDVTEQIKKYNRKIQDTTLAWWKEQNAEARSKLKPSSDDVSIDQLYSFLADTLKIQESKKVYTRGNTFDPIFVKSILRTFRKEDPSKWWVIRDVRSLFEGMLWGSDMDSKFMPEGIKEKFVAHDPCHDISLDVMRFQTLAQVLADV